MSTITDYFSSKEDQEKILITEISKHNFYPVYEKRVYGWTSYAETIPITFSTENLLEELVKGLIEHVIDLSYRIFGEKVDTYIVVPTKKSLFEYIEEKNIVIAEFSFHYLAYK